MNNILYIRTSTPQQTPWLQVNDILTLCNDEYEVYTERLSAWNDNVQRPVFENVIELIKKRKVTNLYVWDLDRLHRNRKRLQEFFILCKTYNCKIHSYRQNWIEDLNQIPAPFDEIVTDLLINIIGWIGQDESQKKSERIRLAVKKTAKGTFSHNGNRWGRKPLPKQTVNRVLKLHKEGNSLRAISKQVMVYDTNNNSRSISKSAVHLILTRS